MYLDLDSPISSGIVLLVEDDPEALRLTSYFLRQLGYRPLEASATVEAVELARANRLEIDLLVTDVAMPVMSGIELAQRVRAERPSLPVIFLVGVAPAPVSQLPGTGFLRKPFSKSELAALVRTTLGETDPTIVEAGAEA
jgi:CheY-like chemotaxis protein